jgi:prolyl-tRNA synthetase
VATPGCQTIEEVAAFLGVPTSRTAKAVFFSAEIDGEERLVFAVTRGDMEVNETKLASHLGARALASAPDEAIRSVGAVPGYASPIGVEQDRCTVVVDELVASSPNLVSGANEEGFHVRGANFGRDYSTQHVIDLASAEAGFACPRCGESLTAERAVEVGNTFKLGTKYSEALRATYLDENGAAVPLVMGCYGIGVGRILATVIERSHDGDGIIWPASIAPYPVHVVVLRPEKEGILAAAEELTAGLEREGIEVLLDERQEMAGVKFKDADLMGMPLRLTVSPRNHAEGVVELRQRRGKEVQRVAYEKVCGVVGEVVARLLAEIESSVG